MAMVEIKPEKVRKDNQNLYRMEGRGKELDRDLKKLRGKNPSYEKLGELSDFYKVSGYGKVDPYAEVDFMLDIESFVQRLSKSNRQVLMMCMNQVTPKIISEDLQLPLMTVYKKIYRLRELLEDFLKEE